jgi:hypothetical protein
MLDAIVGNARLTRPLAELLALSFLPFDGKDRVPVESAPR